MFEALRSLVSFRPKVCSHAENYDSVHYFSSDGTPMVQFRCMDCNFSDHGPVIGPCRGEEGAEDYEGKIVVRGGKQVWPKETQLKG